MTTAVSISDAMPDASIHRCRFCGARLSTTVADLGMSPLCERFLAEDQLDAMEPFFPLRVYLCTSCSLVQLPEYVGPADIFSDYAYFSSYSDSWVDHARRYAERMYRELDLNDQRLVVEVGSNDGYLLQHFVARRIPVLGIEPAENVARVAIGRGVATRVRFFGLALARELEADGVAADLLVGNNVLAQVPDINDFVAGLATLLAPDGLLTLEFPHLLRLLEGNQFDTIYHEHFSYFSLHTVTRILDAHGLRIVDVDRLPTHGGSLRVHARHATTAAPPSERYVSVMAEEDEARLDHPAGYRDFEGAVHAAKRDVLEFLIRTRREGQTVAGYGAPGKANTFLNFCGIRSDLLSYTVDRNPYKHGRFTPGTHIPIHPPEHIDETRPDLIWILPWNLADEITAQLSYVRDWGGRFLVAIPEVKIIE
jgi:SAM-dependent methyltransferase